MTGKIARVDDDLLGKLSMVWSRDRHQIHSIISNLLHELSLERIVNWPQIFLYGRQQGEEVTERLIGRLIAITPGIVILAAEKHELSGLLVRPKTGRAEFILQPFAPSYLCSSLDITRVECEGCPVRIFWQIGERQGEDYERLGIDKGRWEVIEPWLAKWLPKSQEE